MSKVKKYFRQITLAILFLTAVSAWAPLRYVEISAKSWINSRPLKISRLKGKVVVLEFWATWCVPCKLSIPHIIKLYKTYKDKKIVFISLTDEKKSAVNKWLKENPKLAMPFAIACGSKNLADYGGRGIPHAVVIDKQGIIRFSGHPVRYRKDLEAALKKYEARPYKPSRY